MDEIVKVCKKHGNLTREQTRINGGYLRCKLCHCDFSKKERTEKPDFKEKKKVREAKYRKEAPNIIKAQRLRHIEKVGPNFHLIKAFRHHGITEEEFYEMRDRQDNKCAICLRPERRKDPRHDRVCRLCIDHDHKTHKVRALLCSSCNAAIGKFEDNLEIMQRAMDYIKEYRDKHNGT
jgi:hypothetical protein